MGGCIQIYLCILFFSFSYCQQSKMMFLDQQTSIETTVYESKISIVFRVNKPNFVVLALANTEKKLICPGDFVFVSYDHIPIVQDMQCGDSFLEAKQDIEQEGHNDWYIENSMKYKEGGFMIKASRKLITRDHFDFQMKGEPLRILFGIGDGWQFSLPKKTGYRGFKKFEVESQENKSEL